MKDRVWIEKKFALQDGEELGDVIKKVMEAVAQQRQSLSKSLFLHGIFKDHVILRDFEDGKFFRMALKRDGDEVLLSKLQEVRQEFVPAGKVKKSEEADAEYIEVSKALNIWSSFFR